MTKASELSDLVLFLISYFISFFFFGYTCSATGGILVP